MILDRKDFTYKIDVLNNVAHFHVKFKVFTLSSMKLAIKEFKEIAIPIAKGLNLQNVEKNGS